MSSLLKEKSKKESYLFKFDIFVLNSYYDSYGFITFEKKESALSAIQNMHGALLGARHIKG